MPWSTRLASSLGICWNKPLSTRFASSARICWNKPKSSSSSSVPGVKEKQSNHVLYVTCLAYTERGQMAT